MWDSGRGFFTGKDPYAPLPTKTSLLAIQQFGRSHSFDRATSQVALTFCMCALSHVVLVARFQMLVGPQLPCGAIFMLISLASDLSRILGLRLLWLPQWSGFRLWGVLTGPWWGRASLTFSPGSFSLLDDVLITWYVLHVL